MDLQKEIKKISQKINNLENPAEYNCELIKIPEKEFLDNIYTNFKTLSLNDKNNFLSEIAKNSTVAQLKLGVISDTQRLNFIHHLKEKYDKLVDKDKDKDKAKEA